MRIFRSASASRPSPSGLGDAEAACTRRPSGTTTPTVRSVWRAHSPCSWRPQSGMRRSERALTVAALLAALSFACTPAVVAPPATPAQRSLLPGVVPATPPERWLGLIGEYETTDLTRILLEQDGRLAIADSVRVLAPLIETGASMYTIDMPLRTRDHSGSDVLRFERDATGRATLLHLGERTLTRRDIEPRPGTNQLRITPLRPVEAL